MKFLPHLHPRCSWISQITHKQTDACIIYIFFFFFIMLGIEPRALNTQDKHGTTELHPYLLNIILERKYVNSFP
jgi:hypothetical protein